MELKVYDWEKFEKTKNWYVVFFAVIIVVIIWSIIIKNLVWAVFLFFLLWLYILMSLTWHSVITLKISDEWMYIWNRFHSWWLINGFVLEADETTQSLKNIVFLMWTNKYIHTFADDPDKIKSFVLELDKNIELLSWFNETSLEKLIRRLKIWLW